MFLKAQGQVTYTNMTIPIGSWTFEPISFDHFYPTYLADPLSIKFEASYQHMLYSDIDYVDPINKGGGYQGKWVINPGIRMSTLRFSPKSNHDLGISFDFGFTTLYAMRSDNKDVVSTDGIWQIAIAARPAEWLRVRISKHHISTHVGDEFIYREVASPVDYDPAYTQLPVRDDFILMTAIRPLWFFGKPEWDILQLYIDLGTFIPGYDFMGVRFNKPHFQSRYYFQGGAELEYYFKNQFLGGVYAAANISSFQLNAYAPNMSFASGYIFPQKRNQHRVRIGAYYYNGRSLSNQFYNRKEKFIAFSLSYDI